jgi:Lon protease-like protein
MSDPGPARPSLPAIIPIFPLAGVLLLPRGNLPLNIFEPRYLAMTRDALAGDRIIGMIQPADPGARGANPPVYPVGCAGLITRASDTPDGRILMTLTGLSRFHITEELPLKDGYRRVVPDWQGFEPDLEKPQSEVFDRERLTRGLTAYFKQHEISADWEAITKTPGERLVTSLAMICPFEPSEKQVLLEAPDLGERARLLIAIVEMAALNPPRSGERPRH